MKDPNILDSSGQLAIASGPNWPDNVEIVGPDNSTLTCLQDGSIVRLIPSGLVFEQYQFDWGKRRAIPAAQWPPPNTSLGLQIDPRAEAPPIPGGARQTFTFTETAGDMAQRLGQGVQHAGQFGGTDIMLTGSMAAGIDASVRPTFTVLFKKGTTPVFDGYKADPQNRGQGPVFEGAGGWIGMWVGVQVLSDFDETVVPPGQYYFDLQLTYNVFGDAPQLPVPELNWPGGAGCFMMGYPADDCFGTDKVSPIGNQWSFRDYCLWVPSTFPVQSPQGIGFAGHCYAGRYIQFISLKYSLRRI